MSHHFHQINYTVKGTPCGVPRVSSRRNCVYYLNRQHFLQQKTKQDLHIGSIASEVRDTNIQFYIEAHRTEYGIAKNSKVVFNISVAVRNAYRYR
jgi:hypothetical protein